jgi:ArsR family transcriptional regulator, arsenate/arsenite/antimonite-responsive transcriptional repressor
MVATTLDQLETVFSALADRTRLRILGLLLTGEVCVCHIHEALRISQPKASRHLAYLRNAGLVAARRDGLWMHYRLAELPDGVLEAVRQSASHVLGHVDSIQRDLERLQKATGCEAPGMGASALPCCVAPVAGHRKRSRGAAAS